MMAEQKSKPLLLKQDLGLKKDTSPSENKRNLRKRPVLNFKCNASRCTRLEVVTSVLLYLEVLAWGIFHGMIGPTLLDLELKTNTTITQVSVFISVIFAGSLLGVIAAAFIYDRSNPRFFMAVVLTAFGVMVAALPWATDFTTLLIIGAIAGIFAGGIDMGQNVFSIALWKDHGAAFIQAFHGVFGVGTILSSFIAQPFLAYSILGHVESNETTVYANDTNITSQTASPSSVQLNESMGNNTFGMNHEGSSWTESRIEFAYLVSGLILFMCGILFLIGYAYERKILAVKGNETSETAPKEGSNDETNKISLENLSKTYLYPMLIIMFFRHATDVALEITFPDLIMVFAVKGLQWSKVDGLQLTIVLRICFAVSRMSAIFLSLFLSPNKILIMDTILMLVGFISILSAVNLHPMVLWISTGAIAFGMASIFGSTMTWSCQQFPITGKSAVFLLSGNWVGVLTFPALSGFLFDYFGHMAFIHACFADACIWILAFILSNIVAHKWGPNKFPVVKA